MAETMEQLPEFAPTLDYPLLHEDATLVVFRRPVQVLAVMTDALRAEMLANADRMTADLTAQVAEMQQQAARIQFQLQDGNQVAQLRQQVAQEQAKADAAKAKILEQRTQAETLPDGALVQHVQLDGFGSIGVGDTFANAIKAQIVVIRDGIVVEIREQEG